MRLWETKDYKRYIRPVEGQGRKGEGAGFWKWTAAERESAHTGFRKWTAGCQDVHENQFDLDHDLLCQKQKTPERRCVVALEDKEELPSPGFKIQYASE